MTRIKSRARRAVSIVICTLAVVLVGAQPAVAAPSVPQPSLSGDRLPVGFPAGLRQYVAGTPQFKAARWSTACEPGGESAGPNTDPRFRWENAAGRPGGIDVGRYLEAVTPYIPELMWWASSDAQKIKSWKDLAPLVRYPGDSAAVRKPPPFLPSSPAMFAGQGSPPQYHWGFCSAELEQWATPASTQIGFDWARQLDPVSQYAGFDFEQVEKTPCDTHIDGGAWCSIAYYVDCSKAHGAAAIRPCTGWNAAIANEISEGHAWGPQHRSRWQKFTDWVGGIFGSTWDGAVAIAHGVADFFVGIYHTVKTIVDFIKNASTAFDKFVNELKKDSVGLMTSVLQTYNHGSSWDPSTGGFLQRYALMAGLGMILAAFMFFGAIRRAMDSGKREESKDLWVRLLKTFAIIIWAPALFQLLATNGTMATADIVSNWTGTEAGDAVHKLTGVSKVTDSIPGGAFMGFVLFLFLFIGALGLWVGLMVQRYGMEVAATLIAFVAGAYVHPRWQRKVSKAMWVVVGLILAKPLTMIVLGATFGVINEGLDFGGSPTEVLAGLTLATIGVVTTGLAPFAALRWAPILPTSAQSHDHHRGGGGLITGAVIGAAGASLAGRTSEARRKPMLRAVGSGATSRAPQGSLTAAYDNGTLGNGEARVNGASRAGRGVAGRAGAAADHVRRGAGGLAMSGTALAAHAAQSGVVRGRALADHIPEADLPDEEGP